METGVKRKKLVPLHSCLAELCTAADRGGGGVGWRTLFSGNHLKTALEMTGKSHTEKSFDKTLLIHKA